MFYDINYNREYHPYRLVYYNKQLVVADDSVVNADPSPTVATSPTMNLVNNYCKVKSNVCLADEIMPAVSLPAPELGVCQPNQAAVREAHDK